MKGVTNTTGRPVAVPLPGGKTLRLGPHGSGQIALNAVEHGPLKKLVDAGVITLTDEPLARAGGFVRGRRPAAWAPGPGSSGGGRRSGDR